MKITEENFFVPYPEFFQGKKNYLEVYIGFKDDFDSLPITFNIIFTRYDSIENIQREVNSHWRQAQDLDLPVKVKIAIRSIHECLFKRKPKESKFKLYFKKGKKRGFFYKHDNSIEVFIDNDVLPDVSKVLFFPSDKLFNAHDEHRT